MSDIYYKDYGITPVPSAFINKQELANLFKKPKKDKGVNMPRIQVSEPNTVHQADLLYLPHDNGYKYALVVVDLGSRLTDAEPLKDKKAENVKAAFIKIYARGIIKMPQRLQTDPGTEFKGAVKEYFKKNGVYIRYGKPGRHRQQALAERRNQTIGDALTKRMTAVELLTGQLNSEWVDDLPIVIEAMNKKYGNKKQKELPQEPLCEGDSCDILEVGTKVRAILDEPRDITGQKLIGKFRSADIRWNPKVRTVKMIILNPGSPIGYLLDGKDLKDGMEATFYTKNQLQVIPDDEEEPPVSVLKAAPETGIVKAILDKKKEKNKIFYLVQWKGKNAKSSWIAKTSLVKDVPDLIESYENNIK